MTIYKNLGSDDSSTTRTNLHEQIPITGTIISGTYGTFPSESNIKYFSSGDHIDVYDYPYASSSANFIFSMTAGQSADTTGTAATTQLALKNNIYRLFAQQYVGYDVDQNVVPFNVSGVLNPTNTWDPDKVSNCVFMDFSRVLMKDEIQKGTFEITIGQDTYATPFAVTETFTDSYVVATNPATYRSNSPMGDYAFLATTADAATYASAGTAPTETNYGFVFYQAGLVVLFNSSDVFGINELVSGVPTGPQDAAVSSSINDIVNGVRHRIQNVQLNNTTELNSTFYYCRLTHREFNYSSNPSYVSGGQIVVKNVPQDPPVTYITSVGLYSADNELLAVGKLSEPLRKDKLNEFTLRMRLDY